MKSKIFKIMKMMVALSMSLTAQTSIDTVVILHMNDTHSSLLPIGSRDAQLQGERGGIARVKTVVDKERTRYANVLTLHAGDSFIGDLFFNATGGAAEIGALLALDIDAMALGNHEFDLTPYQLQSTLNSTFAEQQFPILSSNIQITTEDLKDLQKYVTPSMVKQFGNSKIGIFSLLTPATNLLSLPSPVFVDTLVLETAAAMVESLYAQGCSMVICLSHLGMNIDQTVAAYIPGIQLIIGAHDHLNTEAMMPIPNVYGDTTYIVQTDGFYQHVGKLTVIIENGAVRFDSYASIPIDTSIEEDPGMDAFVRSMQQLVEGNFGPVYSQQIGYATETFDELVPDITALGAMDTPVGNLVTDAFRDMLKADIALEAGGSTALPLYKGPIVAADLYRMIGYGFNEKNYLGYRMTTFTMSGAAIVMGLETGIEYCLSDQNDEFLIQASGLSYHFNKDLPFGSRCSQVLVNGEPIDPEKNYIVAANEFTGMFMQMLGIPFSQQIIYDDTTEFQVLVSYVAQKGTISPVHRGGIVNAVSKSEGRIFPAEFGLEQNYPNPFNPTTTIRFNVGTVSPTRIAVFDITGREIAVLVNEVLPSGAYEISFDGKRFASGVYYYRITAGSFVQTRKMSLIK